MALISVVIPSRNRPAMLREAVESVLAQTHRDLEIIIVLTGADDATAQVAHGLSYEHPVIRVLEIEARNLAATRNAGLAVASGEWVAFLDDDDLWLPTKLEKQLAKALESSADVVTTNWMRFGESIADQKWMPDGIQLDYPRALFLDNYVSVGALIRSKVLRKVGGFDEKFRACEDWDLWRRASHHHKIAYVDEILLKVRVHGSNMSKNRWLMARTTVRHVIKMHRDTPLHLRGQLRKARRNLLWQLGAAAYETINDRTDDSARKAVRFLRASFR